MKFLHLTDTSKIYNTKTTTTCARVMFVAFRCCLPTEHFYSILHCRDKALKRMQKLCILTKLNYQLSHYT